MLILSRKVDEAILLGDGISLKILGIDGDRIKIGIQAPRDMKIMRAELVEEVKASNSEAVLSSLPSILNITGAVEKEKNQKNT